MPSLPGTESAPAVRSAWAEGNFAKLAGATVLVGELLCDAVELHAGARLLDVATGSGNTALAAARRRAHVTGVDIVPALLDAARARAEVDGLEMEFRVGAAEQLPFPDRLFAVVLSTFGAMFAPDSARAAHEMARVCAPGGRVGIAAWVPDGYFGRLARLLDEAGTGEGKLGPATVWGTSAGIRRLFRGEGRAIRSVKRTVVFRGDSIEAYVHAFFKWFGPAVSVLQGLDPTAGATLTGQVTELVRASNRSGDGTVYIPAEYLESVVRLP
ncbi:MAG TPA: methyltransferase domain-containing protein [Thermoplasmata archaeon]|nr:methyltransferase domain-containing protein [Thermoplasmata archaeon]